MYFIYLKFLVLFHAEVAVKIFERRLDEFNVSLEKHVVDRKNFYSEKSYHKVRC